MHMEAFAFGHMALIALVVVIGLARVVAWILDWREYTATSPIRERAFVAQVRAEVSRG